MTARFRLHAIIWFVTLRGADVCARVYASVRNERDGMTVAKAWGDAVMTVRMSVVKLIAHYGKREQCADRGGSRKRINGELSHDE